MPPLADAAVAAAAPSAVAADAPVVVLVVDHGHHHRLVPVAQRDVDRRVAYNMNEKLDTKKWPAARISRASRAYLARISRVSPAYHAHQ